MVMCYAPFISTLGDKHGETRRARNRFAIHHSSKSIEASDHDCVIVDYNRAPLIDGILITSAFGGCEIGYDRLSPFGNNRADSAKKNCIRPIVLGDGFWIVGAIGSRPLINCYIGIFCWARRSYSRQPYDQCYENELGNSHHCLPPNAMLLGSCPLWSKRDMRHV